jgi:TonB family protein
VPLTQPARPAASTMTSLPGAYKYQAAGIDAVEQKRFPLLWVAILLVPVIIGAAVLTVRFFRNRDGETIATLSAQPSPTQASPAQSSPAQATIVSAATNPTVTPPSDFTKSSPEPTAQAKVIPTPVKSSVEVGEAATLEPDPVLFPPDPKKTSPQKSSSEDYDRIFTGREVTSKARLLSKPEPTYTETARKNQISGTVILRAVLSANGQVTNIHAVSGLPDGLTERAIEAAKQVKFVPATKDGHPVSMWMELQFNFNLY